MTGNRFVPTIQPPGREEQTVDMDIGNLIRSVNAGEPGAQDALFTAADQPLEVRRLEAARCHQVQPNRSRRRVRLSAWKLPAMEQ